MRMCLFLLGVLFLGQPFVYANAETEVFAQAVEKYQSGDYAAAEMLNQSILDKMGKESSAVYYNLGNALFKQGHLGKALLNYLRAQHLSPRDADIRSNITFVRSMVERYESNNQERGRSILFVPFNYLSSFEIKLAFVILFILTGILYLGGLLAGWSLRRVLSATFISGVFLIYVSAGLFIVFRERSALLVSLVKTEARFEPSNNATVYFTVPEGAELLMLRETPGWIKVLRPDGRIGWVARPQIGKV